MWLSVQELEYSMAAAPIVVWHLTVRSVPKRPSESEYVIAHMTLFGADAAAHCPGAGHILCQVPYWTFGTL